MRANMRLRRDKECSICHNTFTVRADSIASKCLSCSNSDNARSHGMYKHKDYGRWESIVQRTTNPNNSMYMHYGARGIQVFSTWRYDPKAFIVYIQSLPNYGKEGYSLDRIHNDFDYEPMNLRWATASEQIINQSVRANSSSKHKGVNYCNQKEKWIVYSHTTGKRRQVGQFETLDKAIECRLSIPFR